MAFRSVTRVGGRKIEMHRANGAALGVSNTGGIKGIKRVKNLCQQTTRMLWIKRCVIFTFLKLSNLLNKILPHNQATILLAYLGFLFQVQILGPKF
jgi:hypothetical protein